MSHVTNFPTDLFSHKIELLISLLAFMVIWMIWQLDFYSCVSILPYLKVPDQFNKSDRKKKHTT